MPERLLYTFYGDDFTGSTDVLEALASNGVEAVLFLDEPTAQQRAEFSSARAIGVAGSSRSQTPVWMEENLPSAFRALQQLHAPVTHYKTCSTFDSAPHIGNIGRALDLGREVFAGKYVPIVVAAPHLGRYVLFANLFAEAEGQIYRIDRHPTMRNHPVTPMHEADLRRHLAAQTATRVESVDMRAFEGGQLQQALDDQLNAGAEAILFDGLDEATAAQTGRLLWLEAERAPMFAVGSSGLTYALIHEWRRRGLLGSPNIPAAVAAAKPIVVLSGSCSPVTAGQIEWALKNGFAGVALDATAIGADNSGALMEQHLRQAREALSRNRSVVIYSALGERSAETQGELLGTRMGRLLRELIASTGVRRVAIAGGDTSSHAVAQLGIHALTFAGPLQPGAPLCRAHAADPTLDGLELVLKGGQIGSSDFFGQVMHPDSTKAVTDLV